MAFDGNVIPFGHNHGPPLDDAEDGRLRKLYSDQLYCLGRCVEDPRMSHRHHLVLFQIIQLTDPKEALAWPGRARLAESIVYYVNGEPRRYSEGTIAVTISELIECGYIEVEKKAPGGRGRALSHYRTRTPSVAEMQAEITKWAYELRAKPRRQLPVGSADVNARLNVSSSDVNAGINLNVRTDAGAKLLKTLDNALQAMPDVKTGVNVNSGVNAGLNVSSNIEQKQLLSGVAESPLVPADVNTGIGQYSNITTTTSDSNLVSSAPGVAPAPKNGKRATRLGDDWRLPKSWGVWALEHYVITEPQVREEAGSFHDYWTSLSGKRATKLDWLKTWRNWIRNSKKRYRLRPGAADAAIEGDLLAEARECAPDAHELQLEQARKLFAERDPDEYR